MSLGILGCLGVVHHPYSACVYGSTNGTNGIPISLKVIPMVPLVIPLVPMVMPMVPFALPMILLVPLVSQWYHWLPMEERRTEPVAMLDALFIGKSRKLLTISFF